MPKTVNLTVRINPNLKQQAEVAAGFLDVSLSQIVRDAFKQIIEKATAQKLRGSDFQKAFEEYSPSPIRKKEAYKPEPEMHTEKLTRQQRRARERLQKKSKATSANVTLGDAMRQSREQLGMT